MGRYHLFLFYGLWVDFVPSLVVNAMHGFPPPFGSSVCFYERTQIASKAKLQLLYLHRLL